MQANDKQSSTKPAIHLVSMSEIALDPLETILHTQGISLKEKEESPLWLAVTDTLGDPRLYDINLLALKSRVPLLVIKPVGLEIEIGLFGAPSACWACYDQRRRLLDGPATYLYDVANHAGPVTDPPGYSDLSLDLAFRHLALEIHQLLRNTPKQIQQGRLRVMQLDSMFISDHLVTRLPYCPACGSGSYSQEIPPVPQLNLDKNILEDQKL